MARHLIDTRPRPATCNRCSQLVLACMSSGMRAAVDPTPLDFDQMRSKLVEGHQAYRMYVQAGKPVRLEYVTVPHLRLPASRYGTYAVGHGCGCHAMDATAFEEPEFPSQAPASAPHGSQGPSDATDVTLPRSEPPGRCRACGELLERGERVGIEWPVWTSVTHKTQSRGPIRGYETKHEGWGTERWMVHTGPDGCPTNGKTTTT